MDTAIKFKTVDEYISALPVSSRSKMQQMREAIKKAAPQAEEMISYNMPAFKLHKVLVYYAAHKAHIGFYPLTTAIREFGEELSEYKSAKGSVQFPLDEPLPLRLIGKMVKFRVQENLEKAKMKKSTAKVK